jgi:hypothetical protein
MRRASIALMALAGFHLVALASPAYAQPPVQPVPYGPTQPVPYNPAPPPSAAPAPTMAPHAGAPVGSDVIYLKNGGLLRGSIIDVIPNSHARMQLSATGEIVTVQWSEISRIENAARGPAAPATAPAAPAVKRVPAILVHIESPRKVALERRPSDEYEWEEVCTSPCDKPVPASDEYHVIASGMKASPAFTLDAQPGQRVVISVDPASKGWFAVGIIGGIVGAVAGIYGLLFVAFGSATSSISSTTGSSTGTGTNVTKQTGDDITAVGWTVAGVGTALLVGGLILTVANWKTRTEQEVQTPVRQNGAGLEGLRREAIWREPTAVDRAAPPPLVHVPIFTRTF